MGNKYLINMLKNNLLNKDGKKFIETIKFVLERPHFFEVERVQDIHIFINGYQSGTTTENESLNDFLTGFREFVINHFEFKEDIHWSRLIQLYSSSNKHSIEVFEKLFEKFIEK